MFNFLKRSTDTFDPRTAEHKERIKLFNMLWSYYEGEHKRHLKIGKDGVDDNVTVNLSRKVVNASTSFLFGKGVTYETDSDVDERTAEEEYLDAIFESDPLTGFSMDDFLLELGQMGAVTGHVFVRIYVNDDGTPKAPHVLDTSLVDVRLDNDNRKRVLEYFVVWSGGKDISGRTIWKRHRIERQENDTWLIYEETTTDGKWNIDDDPQVWDYEFPPIVDCQNIKNSRSFWGTSDLIDADLNDAVNLVSSDINRIIRFHASPKTIMTGVNSGDLVEVSANTMWSISSPDAKAYNLELNSELAASANHKQTLKDEFHEVTETPNINPSNTQVGALSGFALRILYGPLISKTNAKRVLYGGLLERLMHAHLVIGGFETNRVTLKWANPLPTDETEQAAKFQVYRTAGAPLTVAAELAGLPKEKTEGLQAAEDMATLAQRIEMLETLSVTTNLQGALSVIFGENIDQSRLLPMLTRTDVIIEGGQTGTMETPENISSDKGLNGAQIKAAVDLLAGVNAGTVAELNAIELLISLGIDRDRAERMAKAAKTQRLDEQYIQQ